MRLDLVGTCKMSEKKINVFSCQNRLPKVSRNRFLSFFDDFEWLNHFPLDRAEIRQKGTLEAGFKPRISLRSFQIVAL